MASTLAAATATGVLHVLLAALIFAPAMWLTARARGQRTLDPGGVRLLGVAGLIYLVSIIVLHLPRIGVFAHLMWNWQNKLLLFALLLLLVSLWPQLWDRAGFTRPAPHWWFPVLAITLGALGVQLVAGPVAHIPVTTETFLFQAIVPGLDEELLFRGVLFGLIVAALPQRDHRWGPGPLWAVAITTVLFGLAHGIQVDPSFTLTVEPGAILYTAFTGAILGWVRVHTGSLWPAILVHNGINTSLVVAAAVTSVSLA